MNDDSRTTKRYLNGEYLSHNPTWDSEDAPWKAGLIREVLMAHGLRPRSIADIGCGAGAVLREMRLAFPEARLAGFDVSPDVRCFWTEAAALKIEFSVGDFFTLASPGYDLALVLDVVEHLPNPFEFLERLRGFAAHYIFHFPLDLSAMSVLRESPLLLVRRKVGHLHYYTKGLVLALLAECGYEVVDVRYTGAAFHGPQRSWKTRIAILPRRFACAIDRDWGARLFGGETLIILARPA